METTNTLTLERVKALMESAYKLVEISGQESLDDAHKLLQQCLKAQSADKLEDEIYERYANAFAEAEQHELEALKEACVIEGWPIDGVESFFGAYEPILLDMICNRDTSDVLSELLKNTRPIPVRVTLYSDYDCINSTRFESQGGFSYQSSYFGDMADALNLNPARAKKRLIEKGYQAKGRFPNRRGREGKELVTYEDFMQELEESGCAANLLVLIATLDPVELYQSGFDLRAVTIPAGNKCGLFSTACGGGSLMEMKLLRDVNVNLEKKGYPGYGLAIDAGSSYSICETYGLNEDFFGEKLQLAA